MTESRWARRPEGSNWGEFGIDDRLGRLNLLTPEKVLQGVAEVRAGLSFCLSLPLDLPGGNVANPRRHPPRLFAAEQDGAPVFNQVRGKGVVSDDAVLLYSQYSTQWDSFAHAGRLFDADDDGVEEIVYYNGWRGGENVAAPCEVAGAPAGQRFEGSHAHELGIDAFAAKGIQGRGVLVDLHARFGRERVAVTGDQLLTVMAEDGVVVEPGDILVLYTGYDDVILEGGGTPTHEAIHNSCAGLHGGDEALRDWIARSGVAAIASDNRAVELIPAPDAATSGNAAPIHELCLFKLGIPLGEQWLLRDLAAWLREHGRNRFLLTAPPLRLPGAVGSPVTPIATV